MKFIHKRFIFFGVFLNDRAFWISFSTCTLLALLEVWLIFFFGSKAALHCCVSFCCTAKWIRQKDDWFFCVNFFLKEYFSKLHIYNVFYLVSSSIVQVLIFSFETNSSFSSIKRYSVKSIYSVIHFRNIDWSPGDMLMLELQRL